ncbi:predicted protein [Thalassiosira pseudonana CCMP1335]|uniref:Glycosyltransferase family 92 protein n=1 Tax=Thalassiosira pseudonana TaxID=35128 RepID=B8CBL1_THAPS|nr:predicted protein [Thalassiosira pseudonana CCMP1335]EED89148.1 predicted protein [Thalassiosira pseudonana CCMP1335]
MMGAAIPMNQRQIRQRAKSNNPKPMRWSLFVLGALIFILSSWSLFFIHLDVSNGTHNPHNEHVQLRKKDISRSSTAQLNSEVYQPPSPNNTAARRLITYRRTGGRLNNQIVQFIGSLQHAKVLKRTLVVPDERVAVEWTGMIDSAFDIWDLSSLNESYGIDWKSGLETSSSEMQIPMQCQLNKRQRAELLKGGPSLWKEWDAKCPDILDLGRELPFCGKKHQFCGDDEAQREAHWIYEHIKLSSFMQRLMPPREQLAIHSRRAGEGGYDWELCIDGNKEVCKDHVPRCDWHKYCNERTMRGNCAIWSDLSYQIKSKSAWKKDQKDYRFVLASDGTHDWSADFNGQYAMVNSTTWLEHMNTLAQEMMNGGQILQESLGISKFARRRMKKQDCGLSDLHGIIFQSSSTILEMFSLVNSDYFVGGYYSTFSLNACYFRGLHRTRDSNMCWMLIHPGTEYAIPPSVDGLINIPSEDAVEDMPLTLMNDVEHAFVRSSDGRFVAVDRYRFQYQKSGGTNYPTYVGVLGEGEVPSSITCSMGHQVGAKAWIHSLSQNSNALFIVCEDLVFDNNISIQPPLTLKSPDNTFSLTIGSSFVRPRNKPRRSDASISQELILCLAPVHGMYDAKWLIEYLEYHKAVGVSHVHVYNVDMHTPELLAVLQDYRQKGFITRHDWSAKGSVGYTIRRNTDYAAKIDCAARSRGVDDFAIFASIYDIFLGSTELNGARQTKGHLKQALKACDGTKEMGGCSVGSKEDSMDNGRSNFIANVKNLRVPPWYHSSLVTREAIDSLPALSMDLIQVRQHQNH